MDVCTTFGCWGGEVKGWVVGSVCYGGKERNEKGRWG